MKITSSKKLSLQHKKRISEGMQNSKKFHKYVNNPMKRPEVRNKMSQSLKDGYSCGKILPPKIYNGKFGCGYFRTKDGKCLHYASSWELERMKFLNSCKRIFWDKADKNFRVPYKYDGIKRTYFPDFVINHKGKIIVEEVGSWEKGKIEKIKAAKKYFNRQDICYVVLSKKKDLHANTWR